MIVYCFYIAVVAVLIKATKEILEQDAGDYCIYPCPLYTPDNAKLKEIESVKYDLPKKHETILWWGNKGLLVRKDGNHEWINRNQGGD